MAYVIGRVHIDAVGKSLERANLGAQPDESLAGMMRAALIGHTAAVILFLDYGVAPNAHDANGRTPLMEAAFGGHIDTIEELLKRGADVNAQDRDGWTALMEAASKGRPGVVRTLLSHGADARIRNKNGWTALRTTAKCNNEISRLLREAGAD